MGVGGGEGGEGVGGMRGSDLFGGGSCGGGLMGALKPKQYVRLSNEVKCKKKSYSMLSHNLERYERPSGHTTGDFSPCSVFSCPY